MAMFADRRGSRDRCRARRLWQSDGCCRCSTWRSPRRQPKIFVGYSDITFLLVELVQRAELVAFHGPMLAGLEKNLEGAAALVRMLSGDTQ